MPTRRSLDDLAQSMQRILDILAEGRRSLSEREATRWRALALARWQMLQALDGFVEFKKSHLLEPMIAFADDATADEADDLKASNEELRATYDRFVERWALRSPLSVDDQYQAEALKMADMIERTVIADVQELERLTKAQSAGS